MTTLYHKKCRKASNYKDFRHFFLNAFTWERGLDCTFLVDTKSFQKPSELLPGKPTDFFLCAEPAETAVIQSLVKQQESISIPQQRLHPVTASPAEQVQVALKWIQPELDFHDSGKAVNGLSHVRIATGDVDFIDGR